MEHWALARSGPRRYLWLRLPQIRKPAIALGVALVLALASCTAATQPAPVIARDAALASRVPAEIAAAGVIQVATDTTYPPMEFVDQGEFVGVDIDLAEAIGAVLGLPVEFSDEAFSTISAAVAVGRFDLGISALWIDKPTSPLTDMVTYFLAGTQYAVRNDGSGPTDRGLGLCGFAVSVEDGTALIDSLARKSRRCTRAKLAPIRIEARTDQGAATELLITGEVQAMVADTPVIAWALSDPTSPLQTLGVARNVRPYGIAASSTDTEWPDLVRAVVQHLIAGGQYEQILNRWSVAAGAIPEATVVDAGQNVETL